MNLAYHTVRHIVNIVFHFANISPFAQHPHIYNAFPCDLINVVNVRDETNMSGLIVTAVNCYISNGKALLISDFLVSIIGKKINEIVRVNPSTTITEYHADATVKVLGNRANYKVVLLGRINLTNELMCLGSNITKIFLILLY